MMTRAIHPHVVQMLNALMGNVIVFPNFKEIHTRDVDLNVSKVQNVNVIKHVSAISAKILVRALVLRTQYVT